SILYTINKPYVLQSLQKKVDIIKEESMNDLQGSIQKNAVFLKYLIYSFYIFIINTKDFSITQEDHALWASFYKKVKDDENTNHDPSPMELTSEQLIRSDFTLYLNLIVRVIKMSP
ncbi:MAG: hypothetical protein AABZ14_00995, partial [Candidatus Margulisiibacteriota bacterium]